MKILFENEFAIVVCVKNESPYIGEFVDYHYRIGVDKFYRRRFCSDIQSIPQYTEIHFSHRQRSQFHSQIALAFLIPLIKMIEEILSCDEDPPSRSKIDSAA